MKTKRKSLGCEIQLSFFKAKGNKLFSPFSTEEEEIFSYALRAHTHTHTHNIKKNGRVEEAEKETLLLLEEVEMALGLRGRRLRGLQVLLRGEGGVAQSGGA